MMIRSATAALFAALVALTGCHHAIAPKLRYTMPPMALLPMASAGIRDASNGFGATFCSVFDEFKSQEQHGCYHFFRDSQPKQPPPAPLLASDSELRVYRYIVVSGFSSGCVSGASIRAFGDTDSHMAQHGVSLERIDLRGMETPEVDAEQIITYLESETSAADPRPIIFIGYSKGAVDLQAAILRIQQTSPVLESRVKALISVSGMIGGSRLYDLIPNPEALAAMASHFRFFTCPPGKRDLRSMSRQQRQRFLELHWRELSRVPTYALTTVSTPANTSRILRPAWEQLAVYGLEQDSQMAQPEQIPPGATYLGIARADHWAIGVPMEQNPKLDFWADKIHYPRTAMLEALLRFVVADLPQGSRAAARQFPQP